MSSYHDAICHKNPANKHTEINDTSKFVTMAWKSMYWQKWVEKRKFSPIPLVQIETNRVA